MKVLKFGTSAISTTDKIKIVATLISQASNSIVILSAFAETTKKLEEISDYLYKKNPEGANECINLLHHDYEEKIVQMFSSEDFRDQAKSFLIDKINYIRTFTKDLFTLFEEKKVLAQGELFSTGLFQLLLKEMGVNVIELSAFDFMRIDKKNEPDSAYIREHLEDKIQSSNKADIYLTQGYICQNAYGEIDNFHFGGSDYTASLIGAAIDAEEIQIWTDIDAMYGHNSQLISNSAYTVHRINFDEAAELAYFGAKILHPMCILPAKMANIPVRLLNIYAPQAKGTVISNQTEKGKIKAIASKDGIIAINIKSSRMLLAHGFLRKVCEIFEKHRTSIDMLTTSEVGVSVTIDNPKYLQEITDDLKRLGLVKVENDMTIISIVGDMTQGSDSTMSRIFQAMKEISVKMISFGGSASNISFIVRKTEKEKTLESLNNSIF